jgi:hypothetical protein
MLFHMNKSQMGKVNQLLLLSSLVLLPYGYCYCYIAMVLSAVGGSGFAYTSAFDVTTVQNFIWIWNIFYNIDHLCLAAALIGYKYFFL